MKNRRGFLLAEETLKIVIAVICIVFLVYLLTSLYLKNKESKELELAKASLEHLVSEINLKHPEVEIYNPVSSDKFPGGWILISFSLGETIPNSCSNLNWDKCICICNEASYTWREGGLAKDCDDIGICLESEFVVENKKIKIENPPIKLKIDSEGKTIK